MNTACFLHITPDERITLEAWSSASALGGAIQKRSLRAAIVLAADEGLDPQAIAHRLHIQPNTAGKWTRRFVQERLRGLDDRPRSGAPRRISDECITDLVQRSLESTPCEARPWSRRTMAYATGVSRSTVHRIWKALNITPPALRHRCTPAQ